MKKIYLLVFAMIIGSTLTNAQGVIGGLPTFELPTDPGFTPVKSRNLTVYPNPSSGNITVELKDAPHSEVPVIISDASGKTILNEILQSKETSEKASFDLSKQPTGVYFLKVIVNKKVELTKVLISH